MPNEFEWTDTYRGAYGDVTYRRFLQVYEHDEHGSWQHRNATERDMERLGWMRQNQRANDTCDAIAAPVEQAERIQELELEVKEQRETIGECALNEADTCEQIETLKQEVVTRDKRILELTKEATRFAHMLGRVESEVGVAAPVTEDGSAAIAAIRELKEQLDEIESRFLNETATVTELQARLEKAKRERDELRATCSSLHRQLEKDNSVSDEESDLAALAQSGADAEVQTKDGQRVLYMLKEARGRLKCANVALDGITNTLELQSADNRWRIEILSAPKEPTDAE